MKVINILCLVFVLQFSSKTIANQDEYFVSPYLYEFGTGRVDGRLLRWSYYALSIDRPCLTIELVDPTPTEGKVNLVYVPEDKRDICELYVGGVTNDVMNFSEDLSGSEIRDIKIGETEVTFTAELDFLEPAFITLECRVPIKDKKIHKEECSIVPNRELEE